ncbi:MAG TPA: hypothetical protein VMS17_02345 [Gemmataceae bacterium]|nr:hypothetical protein [Gemmataceae bacterium]
MEQHRASGDAVAEQMGGALGRSLAEKSYPPAPIYAMMEFSE